MNRQHQSNKDRRGKLRDAGQQCLDHDTERAKFKPGDTGKNGHRRHLPHTIFPDEGPEQQRIDDHTGNDSHIENVCSQGQQTSVCKEQALDQQHGRDGEKCRAAAQEPRQKNAAADMSAGTRTGNREIDHLGRKHKGPGYRHQGQLPLPELLRVDLLHRLINGGSGHSVHHRTDRRRQKRICHMHNLTSCHSENVAPAVRICSALRTRDAAA